MSEQFGKRVSAVLIIAAMVMCAFACVAAVDAADDEVTINIAVADNKVTVGTSENNVGLKEDQSESAGTVDGVTVHIKKWDITKAESETDNNKMQGMFVKLVEQGQTSDANKYECETYLVTLDNGTVCVYVGIFASYDKGQYSVTMSSAAVTIDSNPNGICVAVENSEKATGNVTIDFAVAGDEPTIGDMLGFSGQGSTKKLNVTIVGSAQMTTWDSCIVNGGYATITIKGDIAIPEDSETTTGGAGIYGNGDQVQFNMTEYKEETESSYIRHYTDINNVPTSGDSKQSVAVYGDQTITSDMVFDKVIVMDSASGYDTTLTVGNDAVLTAESIEPASINGAEGEKQAAIKLDGEAPQIVCSNVNENLTISNSVKITQGEEESQIVTYCTPTYALANAVAGQTIVLSGEATLSGTIPEGVTVEGTNVTLEGNLIVEGTLDVNTITGTTYDITTASKGKIEAEKVECANYNCAGEDQIKKAAITGTLTVTGSFKANETVDDENITAAEIVVAGNGAKLEADTIEVEQSEESGIITVSDGASFTAGSCTAGKILIDSDDIFSEELSGAYANTGAGATSVKITECNITYAIASSTASVDLKKEDSAYHATKVYDENAMQICTIYVATSSDLTVGGIQYSAENALLSGWLSVNGDEIEMSAKLCDTEAVHADMRYDIYTIVVTFATGVNDVYLLNGDEKKLLSIEGNVATITGLVAGTYTIIGVVDVAYSGEAQEPVMLSGTENLVYEVSLGLGITQNPTESGSSSGGSDNSGSSSGGSDNSGSSSGSSDSDEGLSLVEILLIVLVILIAIMVIIVALRLLRS